jgi:hypothetical protein
LKELLTLIGASGGKLPHGVVKKLVKKSQSNGFKAVTQKNINYRLERSNKKHSSDSLIGNNSSVIGENSAVLSDLSDPSSNYVTTELNAGATISSYTIANAESNRGGRRKGSTKASVTENERKREDV